MAIVRFNLTRHYKHLMVVVFVLLLIAINYNFISRDPTATTSPSDNHKQHKQPKHTDNNNNKNNHNNNHGGSDIEDRRTVKLDEDVVPDNHRKQPKDTDHNNHNKNNNNNNNKPGIIHYNVLPTTVHWIWDREEKKACHYSNKRDYKQQPMRFGFHGWYNNDDKCEIACLNQGGDYLDGGIHSYGSDCEKSVHFTMENVPYSRDTYDIIAGIYLDTDVPLPMYGWNQYTYAEPAVPKDSKSQGLVAAFISNCGPQKRLDWLKGLTKAGAIVDSYGRCENNKAMPSRNDLPGDYNGQKLGIGRTYKFIMAFENSFTDDYVTEKLFGVLAVGSVPIYDGAPNALKFAPNNHSVIFAHDYSSPEELAKYLKYLDNNDEEYEKYLTWKKTGPTKDWTAMVDIARIGAECRVCYRMADLHRKEVGMVFGDAQHRKKYIKVPEDWSSDKGIVVYVRHRGTFWFYSLAIPYGITQDDFKLLIEMNIPHKGEFYEAYEHWTRKTILSDKISGTFELHQEMEIEVVFVDMDFYFTNTPAPRHRQS
ncbi:hypothetical protein SAMD00019534_044960, partial [Acytostelium subglobosum LB1]|uniref:hypothetical protein n=1 Tax=Acytostelium subglobosum LB1 TaxID=1410327 RepID=UPI000644DBC2